MSAGRGGGCLIRTESWFCWKGAGGWVGGWGDATAAWFWLQLGGGPCEGGVGVTGIEGLTVSKGGEGMGGGGQWDRDLGGGGCGENQYLVGQVR